MYFICMCVCIYIHIYIYKFCFFLHSFLNFPPFIFLKFIYLYFWLHWVFVAVCGLSLVAASRDYSLLRCAAFSLWWLLLLWSTGSRACGLQQLWRMGSVVVARGLQSTGSVFVAHRLSCSAACGIFPDQGLNLCPLQWQVNS